MHMRLAAISVSISLTFVAGCNNDAPKRPITQPATTTSAKPRNANANPDGKDCEAIADPAQREDCRLWKGVAEAKKKHNSTNVVKHSPGSIQQP